MTSPETRFTFLEFARDFTYKDVLFADTKAGFSLTIVAASVAAYAAYFAKLSQAEQPWLQLAHVFGISGLLCGVVSVLCAMLTILPRSYISHEMATNPKSWIQMRGGVWHGLRRRVLDAIFVVTENVWQRQTKGTPQSLDMFLKPTLEQNEMNDVMYVAIRRAVLVQNLKYLWVGKSILFAFLTFILMGVSLFFGVFPSLGSSLPGLPKAAVQRLARASPVGSARMLAEGETMNDTVRGGEGQGRSIAEPERTKDNPWVLKTPPGTAEYTIYVDEEDGKRVLICSVGRTTLTYDARCVNDLHSALKAAGDWVELGGADEQTPAKEGTVEAWGRSPANPVGGWYGLRQGLRGDFGIYIPPLMEALGLCELEHNPKNNRMRAK